MDKDKVKILIGVIILIVAIIFRLFLDNKTPDILSDKKYIIFDDYLTIIVFNDTVREVGTIPGELLKTKFNIFVNGKYFGKYYFRNVDSGIKLLDDNSSSIKYNGNIVANNFDSQMKISELEIENTSSADYDIANKILSDEGISTAFNGSNANYIKYKADFNGDGNYEYIYSLSNMLRDVKEGYSFIFTYNNNKYNIIAKDIDVGREGYELSISNILDINGDNMLDIVLAKSKYGNSTECYEIYKSNNMVFKKIKGCK